MKIAGTCLCYARSYVVENHLNGMAEGIQQRKQIDERQVFLESIAIYLAGLNKRKYLSKIKNANKSLTKFP